MALPIKKLPGTWVQTERSSHEAWAALIRRSSLAAQIMHLLAARVGDYNAVVISQKTLAELAGASRRGVQNALKLLEDDRWIEVVQLGETGTVNAHVVNDRVVWSGKRENLRYSQFSAVVVVSSGEQRAPETLGNRAPLRTLPRHEEQQLPVGDGLPPEPELPGFEVELPSTSRVERGGEPRQIGDLLGRFRNGEDECDEDEGRWDATLKKVAKQKPAPDKLE